MNAPGAALTAWMAPTAAAALAAMVASSCAPAHIDGYTPKQRAYKAAPSSPNDARGATSGSLWRDGQLAAGLFVDARAFRVNDVVIVDVSETADAERSSDTDLERRGSTAVGLAAVPLLGPLLPGATNVNVTASASTDGAFRGGGSTQRKERLQATVSTVVKQVLDNGNLFIEGHRVILVNSEEHHLYVSGVVRPIDIDQENTVASSRIAEAEIEFVGQGVVTDNQQQGAVPRWLHFIWPF
jgi:flagellar L-ring protein precursor FlgH